jgi:hypothetical protein
MQLSLEKLMMFDPRLVLALLSSLVGAIAWYRALARSEYEKERQYAHIMKNLEQASLAHAEIFKELDAVGDRLSRLEIILLRKGAE